LLVVVIRFNFLSTFNFAEEQFSVILMDLFLAGAETTSTTLTWSLINLMKYPEKQKKIHDEIDNILGDTEISSEYRGRLVQSACKNQIFSYFVSTNNG
jgi:cytochrome P450